jgi:hypothetical protein
METMALLRQLVHTIRRVAAVELVLVSQAAHLITLTVV